MADVQSRYQAIPYGWREIDIAGVVALLIHDQKVTLKYAGTTVQPDDRRLADMLRKKSEIGKVIISKREIVSSIKLKQAKEFLREYFDVMDIPDDEDGLVKFIKERFELQRDHYQELFNRYDSTHNYPDKQLVARSIDLMQEILSQTKDNIALIDKLCSRANDLLDNKDDMQNVESFFKNQVVVFDAATQFEADLRNDIDYISESEEANKALNRIRAIVKVNQSAANIYRSIPELNGLISIVKNIHDEMLEKKRAELLEIVRQCMSAIHVLASQNLEVKSISDTADNYFAQRKSEISDSKSLALLDGMVQRILSYKDDTISRMEAMSRPAPMQPTPPAPGAKKKVYKPVMRQLLFPAKKLESQADIDEYVAKVKEDLEKLIEGCDGVEIK